MALTRPAKPLVATFSARKRHYVRKWQYAAQFQEHGLWNLADQLRLCHESEDLACCTHCGKHWYVTNRCKLRICPLCSFETAKRRATHLLALTHRMKYPKLVTLTMPTWTTDPREGIAHLRQAWNQLRRSKLFKNVRGGAYQIELIPKPNGWHIHIHALLDCPFIPYRQLFTKWGQLIGVKVPQVDIRAATTVEQRAYATKHAAKGANFYANPDRVVDWYRATKGLRLFATFGEWFRQDLEELADESKLEKFTPRCPFCHSPDTTFLARDGPFLMNPDTWRDIKKFYIADADVHRLVPEIRNAVLANIAEQHQTAVLIPHTQGAAL